MKIHPVGAELFHADGQMDSQPVTWTDMTKLTVAFCNSAIAPKNYKNIRLINKYKKVYSQHNNTTLFLVCRYHVFWLKTPIFRQFVNYMYISTLCAVTVLVCWDPQCYTGVSPNCKIV
jgi:hypothetical protein